MAEAPIIRAVAEDQVLKVVAVEAPIIKAVAEVQVLKEVVVEAQLQHYRTCS